MALEVSADELLGLSQETGPKNPATKKLSLKLVRRLQKMEQLPSSKQKALLQTIDGFLRGEGIGS